mgnify:FL=1
MIERRKLEIFVGIGTLGFGLFTLMPAVQMGTQAYDALIRAMPEWQWGLLFASVGSAHLMAVAVNGRRWWTPLARALMCVITAMLYAAFAAGFWSTNPHTTAVYTYAMHSIGAGWCFYFAVCDAAQTWGARNVRA